MPGDVPGDAPDPEQAEWARAARIRTERDAAEARARREREQADLPPPTARGSRRVPLLVAAVVLVLVVVGVVVARRHDDQTPAWVRHLGLQAPHTGGTAPERLGAVSTSLATGATTSSTLATPIDPTGHRPDIDTTGEDFDRIYRQIEVLEDWLLLHPDPGAVSQIYVAGTDPANQLVTLLTQLSQAHQTLDVGGYRILGVTVDSRPSPNQVVLHYADTYQDRTQRDASGTVVSEDRYDGRARLWSLTLDRGRDSRWRVAATTFLGYGDVVGS